MTEITLRPITAETITELWAVSYGPKADLEWMNWDGPYFQDPVFTWAEFRAGFGKSCIDNPLRKGIYADDQLIGIVTGYWEDNDLHQWLEFGIAIYDPHYWNRGVGSQAIKQWVTYLFALEPDIQRIGYTTWSGNHRMMTVGEKLGMTKEARIRKVRFWQGQYYDSVKYGVLRDEWQSER